MRRLFAAVLAGLLLAGCGGAPTITTQDAPPVADNPGQTVFQVIGADAPAWMRVGGPGRYLCDGTQATGGDQVELQAACDASKAAMGAVEIVGTLYVSKPTAAPTEYTATAVVYTNATPALSAMVWDGTFAITDVAVGDVIRLSAGDNGAENLTVEDQHEEMVTTVTAVDVKTSIITIADTFPSTDPYTALVMRRLVGAIRLTSGYVVIRGSDFTKSGIYLATDQNCDIIHVEPVTSIDHTLALSKVYLCGVRAVQGDHVDANIDIRCNGLLVNSFAGSTYIQDVVIANVKGDAMWVRGARTGLQHVWLTHNSGGGLYMLRGSVYGREVESYDNNGPAAVFQVVGKVGDDSTVQFTKCQSNGGAYTRNAAAQSEYSLKILNSDKLAIHDSTLSGNSTNVLGAVYLDAVVTSAFTGNIFLVNDTAGGVARSCIQLTDAVSFDNVITGNVFDTGSTVPIARANWDYNLNVIKDNTFEHDAICTDYATMVNNSGGDIIGRSLVSRSALGVIYSATAGSPLVLGVTYNETVATTARIRVQTLGPVAFFPISTDSTAIAVGDELTASHHDGLAIEAAATETVIAIARSTHAAAAAHPGERAYVAATLVVPYVKP